MLDEKLSPLSLASTEELVTELRSRFELFVIAGVKPISGGQELFWSNYYGGLTGCIGVVERCKARMIDSALHSAEVDDDDEECGI